MHTQTLTVGTGTVVAEVVTTPQAMAKGLSGRESLDFDQGMLFAYDEPTRPSFWMQGMRFPIDIVWLSDGRVVGIEHRVPVGDGTTRYSPKQDVDAVLELAASAAEFFGLKVGDPVVYKR